VLLLFGNRIGKLAGVVASSAVGASFAVGLWTYLRLLSVPGGEGHGANARSAVVDLYEWIRAGSFSVDAALRVDQLAMIMVLVVTGVGTLIHVYSIGYMQGDPRYPRFFAYMNLFAAAMLLLVLADNLVLLYVGWEGVGLCSFLLIGFWFERPAASNAAKKAFLVNRLGDFSFLLGIFLVAAAAGSLAVGEINEQAAAMAPGIATIASLLLFGGAVGKSAQIPLYVWLPDAMEGPTPVSALIHAATMVTAGVYMVARLSPLFEASGGTALTVVMWVGAATALWAALMAAAEFDIKRVLAYSTVSQLGYMFVAMGVGAYSAGIFHLVTHAFFKALMFLGAGAVMHALGGETDMRRMGGLRKVMPLTGLTFAAGWLAISGIIPFSGFFSKDAILASAWNEGHYVVWAVGVATAFLTAFYMSRLYLRVFEGDVRVPEGTHAHDAPPSMAAALVPLGVLAVIGGVINLPGSLVLEHFLEPVVGESKVPAGLTPWLLGAAALAAGLAGILAARGLYLVPAGAARRRSLYARARLLVDAARAKFYVDEAYGRFFVLPGRAFATFCANVLDAKVIDGAVAGLGKVVAGGAWGGRKIQTGYVRSYALIFFVGVALISSILVLRMGL
jgi:NADH-quinone oxidoreductase subunit L